MAYTAPTTRITGDMITASIWNTDIVDNIAFLYADRPTHGCRVYNTGALSINAGATTALTFDTERYDTDAMHSTSSNTGRITIVTAGKYYFAANLLWSIHSSGVADYGVQIRLNGSTTIARQDVQHTTTAPRVHVSGIYSFAAADYIECMAYNGTSSTETVDVAANYSPEFMANRIGSNS